MSSHEHPGERIRFLFISTAVALIGCISILSQLFGTHFSLGLQAVIATTVQIFSGWPFYKGAWLGIKKFKGSGDTPVALGITAAYLFNFYLIFSNSGRGIYFENSTLLITLLLIGRIMVTCAMRLAENKLHDFLALKPKTAHVKRGADYIKISADALQVDDLFIVHPGESVPADGEIIKGSGVIDESMFTGENLSAEKNVGSSVFAGTVNRHGIFIAKASQVGCKTALHRTLETVKQAQQSKIPIERFTDKLSPILVTTVLIISLLTLLMWTIIGGQPTHGILSAISVLVIASPLACSLAVPSVTAAACNLAASKGIFIKNGKVLETAPKIQRIIVDKTSTITEGSLAVDKVSLSESYYPIVKTLCEHSKEPAYKGILEFLNGKKTPSVPTMLLFRTAEGRGMSGYFDDRKYLLGTVAYLDEEKSPTAKFKESLRGEIGTVMALGTEKLAIGHFILSDQIKPGTKEAISALKKLGIETLLLTDSKRDAAEVVARAAQFDFLDAEVLPTDKVKHVEMAKREGKIIAMVGDGHQDAAALAAADLGFATATGADISMKSASVGLMHSHLMGVVTTIQISKASLRKITQNLILAIGYNLLAILLAALGFINPILAAIAMSLTPVAIICNSLLLNKMAK